MDKAKLRLKVLRKIPVFHALPPSQVTAVLGLCSPRELWEDEVLCHKDSPSDEMYILVSGELAVLTDDDLHVASLTPVTTVGEMGVITGQPRSATVRATRPCRVLALRRDDFDSVLEGEPGLRARVLRNFIQILSARVTDDNLRLRDYELELRRFEGRVRGLERQRRQATAREDAALDVLERAGVDRAAAVARVEAAARAGAETILVVDDEEEFRQLMRQTLAGYRVVEAADGDGALEIVDEAPPDLVVTDVMMPGVDGHELTARIHEAHPELPVLAVSGYVDESDIDGQGFAGFMDKPVRVRDFRALVAEVLARAG